MVTACVYTRLSKNTKDSEEEESLGVARQEKDCRALADRLGLTVAHVYCDDGISAYTGKCRPQYEAMLADVARGRYGAILA